MDKIEINKYNIFGTKYMNYLYILLGMAVGLCLNLFIRGIFGIH